MDPHVMLHVMAWQQMHVFTWHQHIFTQSVIFQYSLCGFYIHSKIFRPSLKKKPNLPTLWSDSSLTGRFGPFQEPLQRVFLYILLWVIIKSQNGPFLIPLHLRKVSDHLVTFQQTANYSKVNLNGSSCCLAMRINENLDSVCIIIIWHTVQQDVAIKSASHETPVIKSDNGIHKIMHWIL